MINKETASGSICDPLAVFSISASLQKWTGLASQNAQPDRAKREGVLSTLYRFTFANLLEINYRAIC
jgi:hypothetical protein